MSGEKLGETALWSCFARPFAEGARHLYMAFRWITGTVRKTGDCTSTLQRWVISWMLSGNMTRSATLTNAMPRAAFLELTPEHMTGKLVNES